MITSKQFAGKTIPDKNACQHSMDYTISNLKHYATHKTFSVLSFKKNLGNISLSRDISLRLVRSLVRNRPPAENTHSVSTEVGAL